MREPRTATIVAHATAALRAHKPLTERALADAVVEHYHQRTALHERTVEFHAGHTADAYEAAARANAQLLKRMLVGEVRLPADLEEAIVLALPEPQRRQCMAALADRYGLLAVPKPALEGDAQTQQIADLFREVSEAVQRIGPMFADGHIDHHDAALVPPAVRELLDVIAACTALIRTLHTATAPPSAANVSTIGRGAR